MGLIQAYGALLLSALLPIVAGSHSSLVMPKSARKLSRKLKGQKEHAEEDDEEDEEIDRLTKDDAWLFPVLGSVTLFTLFIALKYYKQWVNLILGYYFSAIGTAALARLGSTTVKAFTSEDGWRALGKWKLGLFKGKEDYASITFTWIHLLSLASAIGVTAFQKLVTDHWAISNVVALSLSFNAISVLRLDSFLTGSMTLGGLFLYDIWWVFGTGVMESVARDFDAPIKIVFPKHLGTPSGFTLLGLGDIVLPGIFIALALRFDYSQALKRSPQSPPLPSSSFPRPYFISVFIAYILGLVVTITVMHTFKAGQPALLYLSPACVGSVVLCAWARGEIGDLWGYDDGENDEKKPEQEKEKKAVEAKEDKKAEDTPFENVEEKVVESSATEPEKRTLRSRVKS